MKFFVDKKRTNLYPLMSTLSILIGGLLHLKSDNIYYVLFVIGVIITLILGVLFLVSFKYVKKVFLVLTILMMLFQVILIFAYQSINDDSLLLFLEYTPLIVFLSLTYAHKVAND